MKTKRKVKLSEDWLFPIRKFEFTTAQNLDESIESIQSLHQILLDKKRRTKIEFSQRNSEGAYKFLLSTTEIHGAKVYIKGEVENNTKIQGTSGIGNSCWLTLHFIGLFLVIGGMFVVELVNTWSLRNGD